VQACKVPGNRMSTYTNEGEVRRGDGQQGLVMNVNVYRNRLELEPEISDDCKVRA
jgi:hypothetical protein